MVTTLAVALLTCGDQEQRRKKMVMLNIKVETYKQWEIPTHLNLSALYDCPVQLLSCSVSLSCALEGDESKALQVYSVLFFISFDH